MRKKQTKPRNRAAGSIGKKPRSAQALTPGEVWAAYDSHSFEFRGYVVTERGNPQRLIAASLDHAIDDETFRAKQVLNGLRDCKRIARDPDFAGRSGWVVDMRRRGRLDSDLEVGVEQYSLWVSPLGSSWRDAIPQHPFCRFHIAKQILALKSEKDRRAALRSIQGAVTKLLERQRKELRAR